MDTVFKHVLLVDSNRVSNFFNQIVLKKTKLIEHVISLDTCRQALDFLDQKKTLNPIPNIIFLSLNTPFMNGWEFLYKYESLRKNKESNIVILYDTELLKDEQYKLSQYPFVKAVINKNIDISVLHDVFEKINRKEDLQLMIS